MCQVELVLCWTDIMLICAPFPENNNVLSRLDLLFQPEFWINSNFIHIIDDLAGYYSKGQKYHLAHYCFNPSCKSGLYYTQSRWQNIMEHFSFFRNATLQLVKLICGKVELFQLLNNTVKQSLNYKQCLICHLGRSFYRVTSMFRKSLIWRNNHI